MLSAKGITRSFGELQILKGIDLEIAEGEVVSIVGSSGAGKTTLLQILGTLDKPNSGQLLLNGKDPFSLTSTQLSRFRNQSIGFIFQFHQLLPEFTAAENVMLPALIAGMNKSDARQRAIALIEVIGLKHRADHRPSELSGGEQQRIAVCRALVNKPSVVFADEPSGNLDSANSEELHKLFFELREKFNQTFIIVTHNETLAGMADRRLVMRDGLIVQ
ncbi:MAG: ABC transporter ATP-binding protein [Cryomorphaceae bacterium]|nr:ABC transporter ATP-binding protein [Cryomorphaceae bacterium]